MRIVINSAKPDAESMADLLRNVAGQLDQGYTSGFYPHWTLTDEEDDIDDITDEDDE